MKLYPLNIELKNRLCIVVGGGNIAARKTVGLLAAEAKVRLISPYIIPKLTRLLSEKNFEWYARNFQRGDIEKKEKGCVFLVYAATDNSKVQSQIAAEARRSGVLLNSADSPEESDFHVPAHFRRGDILVTTATGGKSPALASVLRKKLEETVGDEYRVAAELLGELRKEILLQNRGNSVNSAIFKNIVAGGLIEFCKNKDWSAIDCLLNGVLGQQNNTENNTISVNSAPVAVDITTLLHNFQRSHETREGNNG